MSGRHANPDRDRTGAAFTAVWLTAHLAAGLLLGQIVSSSMPATSRVATAPDSGPAMSDPA